MSGTPNIDRDIRPLVETMNNTGWITTVSSCAGHNGCKPYVAMYCRMDKVNFLTRVLDIIEHDFFPLVMFECCLIHESEIQGYQGDAPEGWLALHLRFNLLSKDSTDNLVAKHMVFGSLAGHLGG